MFTEPDPAVPHVDVIDGIGGVGQGVNDHLLAGNNATEPEPLDIQGEMPDQSQAGPPRRQDRPPEGVLVQPLQDA